MYVDHGKGLLPTDQNRARRVVFRSRSCASLAPSFLPGISTDSQHKIGYNIWTTMQRCSLVMLVLLHAVAKSGSLTRGTDEVCTGEGRTVHVPGITDDPCITCLCKGGRVECEMNVCPQLEGCRAVILDRSVKGCCGVCKGCSVNGTVYPSGAQWTHPDDPCLRLICQAGVLTVSRQKCLADCSSPVRIPGQCCPSCSDCMSNDTHRLNALSLAHDDISRVQCSCNAGQVTCAYHACPVLNCPGKAIHKPAGDMCPKCKGIRTAASSPRDSCFFSNSFMLHGVVIHPDKCTSCTCWHGTVQCQREVCAPPPCDVNDYHYRRGSCCPTCKERRPCVLDDKTYQSGSQWMSEACTRCRCQDGLTSCSRQSCNIGQECPQGSSLKDMSDSCCPKCVVDPIADFPAADEEKQQQMEDKKQQQRKNNKNNKSKERNKERNKQKNKKRNRTRIVALPFLV